jgi:hypothetical protein
MSRGLAGSMPSVSRAVVGAAPIPCVTGSMLRRNAIRASLFAEGCCSVFWCSLAPCKPAALFADRSLERGQILGKDVFRTAVKKELIYDFVKYTLTVAQSGPKAFVVMMNDSYVDVELQVCSLVHACSVARAAVGFYARFDDLSGRVFWVIWHQLLGRNALGMPSRQDTIGHHHYC